MFNYIYIFSVLFYDWMDGFKWKRLLYQTQLKTHTTLQKYVEYINPKQQQLYIKYELTLLDIYLSKDYKTGETITVMVFSKEESKPYYEKWLRHELV